MNTFLVTFCCIFFLLRSAVAAAPETAVSAIDRDLQQIDQFYSTRLKGIDSAKKQRLAMARNRYKTRLNVLLRKKKAEGKVEYVREIEAELKRLAGGKATSGPAKHADTYPEISQAVAARLRSEKQAQILDADDTVAVGDRIALALEKMEQNLVKKGDDDNAARVRAKLKEMAERPELKDARSRAEEYKAESEKRQKEARRKKFLEDLAAGRLGPFARRAPNAAWRPRLTLGKAWQRMQALDCDYSVFEYFSGRSVAQLLPEIAPKPDAERVRYLLYMVFNRLDAGNAATQLKSFPPELVQEGIRTSFWPEELHPLKPDGAYFWGAWASYTRDGEAHGILQLAVKKQKDKDEIHAIHSYRSAPIPKKGWKSVPASSYLAENAQR